MSVVPLQQRGAWFGDARGDDRALRVSWHAEAGCVVLSTWRSGTCVGTSRLSRDEAARLVAALQAGLHDTAMIDTPATG